jgi:4,5-DOPA dioxygenase extradiol
VHELTTQVSLSLSLVDMATGFPDEMYQIKWTPAGSPEIAERVAGALRAEGVDCRADPKHGLDHGAWVPLHLMYPEADIPVLQLSVIDSFEPSVHYKYETPISHEHHRRVRCD